jgi:O-antigen/teichoic acid export membrane protein
LETAFDKIKQLGTDTAIYGVSTILGRFLNFLLTPIYTYVFQPSDFGIVAIVYSYIAFLNVVYGYGMESAYLKYATTRELGTPKENFTVPFISVSLTSLLFSGLIVLNAVPVAQLANIPATYHSVVPSAAGIMLLDAAAMIPFACLRLQRKAVRFGVIRLINIIINICLNILLLFHFHMGVEGVFLSGVISSALTLLMLTPTVAAHFSLTLPRELFHALLRFGLPYVPAGLATMMIQVIDRPILEALTDTATVGIYQANYRLGIFMMLLVSAFDFAWRPFFLSQAREREAKQLFARILTYFLLVATSAFLVLSFFLEDVVRLPLFSGHTIIEERYWSGLHIVPVVLLAYVFLGVSNNIVAGIYIEKRTQKLPAIAFLGAIVNVVINLLFIPLFGIMGAAIATLMSYAVMAVALYFTVQRFYPVQYEFGRITKMLAAAGAVFFLYSYVNSSPWEILWKVSLVFLFLVLMYIMRFFQPSELRMIANLMRGHGIHPSDQPIDRE